MQKKQKTIYGGLNRNMKRKCFICEGCGEPLKHSTLEHWKWKCVICNRVYSIEELIKIYEVGTNV